MDVVEIIIASIRFKIAGLDVLEK
uniref:Uncharacterized protein n=1 Tax=Acrobeloides nanus TaxID=290746 RepID=A0A914EN97_9BILA